MTTKFTTRVAGGAFALALGASIGLPAVAGADIPVNPGPTPSVEVTPDDDNRSITVTMSLPEAMAVDSATCGYSILFAGVDTEPSSIAWNYAGGGGPEFRITDNNFLNNDPSTPFEASETFDFYDHNEDADNYQLVRHADGPGTYTVHTTCWWDGDRISASYGESANYTLANHVDPDDAAVTDITHFDAPETPAPPVDDDDDDDEDDDDNGGSGSLDGVLDGGSLGGGSAGDTGSAAAAGSLVLGGGIAAAVHAHNMGMF